MKGPCIVGSSTATSHTPNPLATSFMEKIDFFISHAFEDKKDLVKALAYNLIINGALVFYDEFSIRFGDSISDSINKGLIAANHAIVILSKYFFEKGWTNAELQAIFNKSISENFKILIVYHGITHKDVIKKYPLLADKKAIDSTVGVEKITEALFKSINKPFNLSYLKHEISRTRDITEGISVSMFVGFPNRLNTSENKTLYEMGDPDIYHSRMKIFLWRYERIYFEIIDSKFRRYSLSVPFNKWVASESHFIHVSLDVKNTKMQFIVDDNDAEEINIPDLYLEAESFKTGTGIIGCSLNLSDPCPLTVISHSIGAAGMDVLSFYKASLTLNKALSKI